MRIEHVHQYTEHHRYYTYRDHALSGLDLKTLTMLYQPMIGAVAVSLYQLLYYHISESQVGYSGLEPQRKLFLSLGIEMNDAGRRRLADEASRLEAVGLLQTSRIVLPGSDDLVYEYALQPPLTPADFFRTNHLVMLLRDKIGKYAVVALGQQFYATEPDELAEVQPSKQSISVPFYELFRLNMHAADDELEQALSEVAPARASAAPRTAAAVAASTSETAGITYGELILRFPRNAGNRAHVERLRTDEEGMAAVNYVAYKYNLSAADMCRLLDEDGVFASDGELLLEELQLRANQLYRQDRKRSEARNRATARIAQESGVDGAGAAGGEMPDEVAVETQDYLEVPKQLTGRCDAAQYNMLLRNEPHTRFLRKFFPGAVPEWIDRVFERIDLNYKMPDGAINVLIHYVLGMNESQRVTKTFIEAVASNMLVRGIDTYEKAVAYVRDQQVIEERKKAAAQPQQSGGGAAPSSGSRTYSGGGRGRGGAASRKPAIPIVEQAHDAEDVSPEELERILRLAKQLGEDK